MSAEHARVVQPEQTAGFFDAKLQGLSYEELVAHAHANPKNDKGYATWPAWNEFFLPRTPSNEEIRAFMEAEAASAEPADVGGLTLGGASEEDGSNGRGAHPGLLASTKDAPGALFEHMVLRLAPFSTRGVLWYQGESDDEIDGAQARHAHALQTIMADWRAAWRYPNLPFFVVQLPGFRSWMGFGAKDWITIRRGQQEAVDHDDHAWLCSAGDAGEEFDIHPKDKSVLGRRLALLALRHVFGKKVDADAPRFADVRRNGRIVTLAFEHAEDGLCVEGDRVAALEVIAGGRPVPFSSCVRNNTIVVQLEEDVDVPVEIRFAQSGWYCINVTNGAGVPVLPFVATCRR